MHAPSSRLASATECTSGNSGDDAGKRIDSRKSDWKSDAALVDSHHFGAPLPAAFVSDLLVNGQNLRVSMTEQPSGQSNIIQCIAKLAHSIGGFHAVDAGRLLRARLQVAAIANAYRARTHVLRLRNQLIGLANTMIPTLVARGGGCRDIEVNMHHSHEAGEHLQIDVIVEVLDRCDAGVVDLMIHSTAPLIEQLTHGTRGGTSLSELADRQVLCAQISLDARDFSLASAPAAALAGRIVELHNFICTDAQLLSACNAGILAAANAVRGVLVTAGDGAVHVHLAGTAHSDHGAPLAFWYRDHHGYLTGRIALSLRAEQTDASPAAATDSVGRAAHVAVQHTSILSHAVAAIGLAQGLASLHAHATAAIAQSNPAQHARDVALLVGARGREIDQVAQTMTTAHSVRCDRAVAALDRVRGR